MLNDSVRGQTQPSMTSAAASSRPAGTGSAESARPVHPKTTPASAPPTGKPLEARKAVGGQIGDKQARLTAFTVSNLGEKGGWREGDRLRRQCSRAEVFTALTHAYGLDHNREWQRLIAAQDADLRAPMPTVDEMITFRTAAHDLAKYRRESGSKYPTVHDSSTTIPAPRALSGTTSQRTASSVRQQAGTSSRQSPTPLVHEAPRSPASGTPAAPQRKSHDAAGQPKSASSVARGSDALRPEPRPVRAYRELRLRAGLTATMRTEALGKARLSPSERANFLQGIERAEKRFEKSALRQFNAAFQGRAFGGDDQTAAFPEAGTIRAATRDLPGVVSPAAGRRTNPPARRRGQPHGLEPRPNNVGRRLTRAASARLRPPHNCQLVPSRPAVNKDSISARLYSGASSSMKA